MQSKKRFEIYGTKSKYSHIFGVFYMHAALPNLFVSLLVRMMFPHIGSCGGRQSKRLVDDRFLDLSTAPCLTTSYFPTLLGDARI